LKLGWDEKATAALLEGVGSLIMMADLERANVGAADLEARAVETAMKAVRPLLEMQLQRRLDRIDAEISGDSWCESCGQIAQSQGRRTRPWMSLAGQLRLRRRYAYCKTCNQGRSRAQQELGLTDSPYTPRMEEVCTLMATTVPHGMAVDLVKKLVGVEISPRGIQQMTERRAQRLQATLHDEAKHYACYDDSGLPVAKQERPPDALRKPVDVAYLEMDGVVPMTREELLGPELSDVDRRRQRHAKREGARGGRGRRYRLVGREVKNAVLYTASACVPESAHRSAITHKRYVSHLGAWQQFAMLVWVAILRMAFDRAKLLVVLSDGAEWIRSLCKWLPIKTLLILDLFHVKHRIWEVANLLHGEHTPAARAWAETQCLRVESGHSPDVVQALRFVPRRHQSNALVRALTEYLESNSDRMHYPTYRSMGLRVGSGAIESANYHVTGARLKLQGMRWSEQGAREMAYLRADLFNGNWERRTRGSWAA
jgi:hypothetical protein